MQEIIYDKPIEVTEKLYRVLMHYCSGIVAGREENGRFFIKVWMMKYQNHVKAVLSSLNSEIK